VESYSPKVVSSKKTRYLKKNDAGEKYVTRGNYHRKKIGKLQNEPASKDRKEETVKKSCTNEL
jgi:hypothetical protein